MVKENNTMYNFKKMGLVKTLYVVPNLNNNFFIADNCPYAYIKTFKIQIYLYK